MYNDNRFYYGDNKNKNKKVFGITVTGAVILILFLMITGAIIILNHQDSNSSLKQQSISEGLFSQANAYYDEGRYKDALTVFDGVISSEPDNENAYVEKINFLFSKKRYLDCLNLASEYSRKFPQNSELLYYMGDCYSEMQQTEKAISFYKAALQIDSRNPELTARLGWEYYYDQNYTEALTYANKSLELDKNSNMAQSLIKSLKDEEAPEAEKIVNFFKKNYLYLDKVENFEEKAKIFSTKKDPTNKDIMDFINSVKVNDDKFTFVIADDQYTEMNAIEASDHITSKMLDESTYFIRIDSFNNVVDSEFKEAMNKITSTENKNLIIDLRDNPGGLGEPTNNILDMLLPKCTTSSYSDREGTIESYDSTEEQIKFKKIIILVNENTASSAELLTLGLKKYLDNVIIIGHPTVGKGVGQVTYESKKNKYIIFVVNFYWKVKGINIMGDRIHPDILVEGSSEENYIAEVKKVLN